MLKKSFTALNAMGSCGLSRRYVIGFDFHFPWASLNLMYQKGLLFRA